jgi:N utilization substance protein B
MRRQSRELSLQILFQTEFAPQMNLKDLSTVFEQTFDTSVMDYTMTIVQGVKANIERIDSKISTASVHWKIERMASVDRNILRIAVYEMLFAKETLEPKIVINEAIEVAKIFGTQESSAFVNGLLDQILRNEQ